jgi:hypothetical protein
MTTSSPAAAPPPSLHELVHTLPAPLVGVLAGLGPPLAHVRRALEIVSWAPARVWPDGWLAVALWWALCLGASPGLRHAACLAINDVC